MEKFQEIELTIHDLKTTHYGGSQYWFPRRTHQLSGCGPVAAANITAYLAKTFPDKYMPLYTYNGIINKNDFVNHMVQIRRYVKPGMFGLTSVDYFSESLLAYSQKKGIILSPHILPEVASMHEGLAFISEALLQRLPVAILVLKHQLKEMEDYVWHWMTITNLRFDSNDSTPYISVSTYGEHREINMDLLWNRRRPQDIIRLAYFD